ncbi:hypothetical protein [Calothrix sp. 336/3]|uniref:hypothetical protein n=1 Tax=Calothrix sp. 336/3 TaxID=1337936 RepID=UPI001187513F|nr:hypothetical protein [Calothrix sp. 336/3]
MMICYDAIAFPNKPTKSSLYHCEVRKQSQHLKHKLVNAIASSFLLAMTQNAIAIHSKTTKS